MDLRTKLLTTIFLILWGAIAISPAQKAPDIATLLADLSRPKATDRAARQVLQVATKDPMVRKQVVDRLPAMIAQPQSDEVRLNAVRLAGQLKAIETIPSLVSALALGPLGAPVNTTFGTQMQLQDDAVAKALSQIGDPAIPDVTNLLENGDQKMRRRVVLILTNVDSSTSRKVLKDRLKQERDPKIRYLIESALRS